MRGTSIYWRQEWRQDTTDSQEKRSCNEASICWVFPATLTRVYPIVAVRSLYSPQPMLLVDGRDWHFGAPAQFALSTQILYAEQVSCRRLI